MDFPQDDVQSGNKWLQPLDVMWHGDLSFHLTTSTEICRTIIPEEISMVLQYSILLIRHFLCGNSAQQIGRVSFAMRILWLTYTPPRHFIGASKVVMQELALLPSTVSTPECGWWPWALDNSWSYQSQHSFFRYYHQREALSECPSSLFQPCHLQLLAYLTCERTKPVHISKISRLDEGLFLDYNLRFLVENCTIRHE